MTRADWTAIATAIRTARSKLPPEARETVDSVALEIAQALKRRSVRFDPSTFQEIAGGPSARPKSR